MNKGIKFFDLFTIFTVTIVSLLCLAPFIYVASMSLSSNEAILAQKVGFIPVGFTLETYKTIFSDQNMISTLLFSIFLTVVCTVVSMVVTICAAYPLTKPNLKGRNAILLFLIITMYFSGGMIPDYMLIKNLNLLDTFWVLVLPGAMSVFNMLILKSFFSTLPESLTEAAALEGCSELGILFKIVLPLSLPVLATLSLFYAVGRWNGFQDALIYITDKNLYTIQLKLYQIISANQQLDIQQAEGNMGANIAPEALKAASVMFTTIPILLVYPKLQKYFVSGTLTGAVKG